MTTYVPPKIPKTKVPPTVNKFLKHGRLRKASLQSQIDFLNGKREGMPVKVKTTGIHVTKREKRLSQTDSQIGKLLTRFNYRCHWCDQEVNPSLKASADLAPTKDHWIRLCDGGMNGNSNLVLACRKCNGSRHNEWYYQKASNETRRKIDLCNRAFELGAREVWGPDRIQLPESWAPLPLEKKKVVIKVFPDRPVCNRTSNAADGNTSGLAVPQFFPNCRSEPWHERIG